MAVEVKLDAKVRHLWALKVAGWLLTLPRVEVRADGRRLGNGKAFPFRIVVEDVEIGKVEP